MLGDIGKRFLEYPEYGNGGVLLQIDVFLRAAHFAGNPEAFAELACLPFDRRDDAEIHDARAQVARHAPDGVDSAVHQPIDGLNFFQQYGVILSDVAAQPIQVDLDRGEVSAQVVVDLLRDADALMFSCRHDMRRHLAQPFVGFLEFRLPAPALGDIDDDAFPDHPGSFLPPRARAQADPFHIVKRLDPQASFPVPSAEAGCRFGFGAAQAFAILGQNDIHEQLRVAPQRLDGQAQHVQALIAHERQGVPAIFALNILENHAGGVGDDGGRLGFFFR